MVIKNITGNGSKNAAKVIGFGTVILQPDEEKTIPDSLAYVDETDEEGRPTGKKVILPALKAQEKIGAITIKETVAKKTAAATPKQEQAGEEAATAEAPKAGRSTKATKGK